MYYAFESGSERIPRGFPRGKRVKEEHYYSLRIGASPQLAAESFKWSLEKIVRREK